MNRLAVMLMILLLAVCWFTPWAGADYINTPRMIADGTVGAISWELRNDGTLHIIGFGHLRDFDPDTDPAPWTEYRHRISRLVIHDGITAIGEYAFANLTYTREILFQGDAPDIADTAFTRVTASVYYFVSASGWELAAWHHYGGRLEWFVTTVAGDVTFDGAVDNRDLVNVARYMVGLVDRRSELAYMIRTFGDINYDGTVDNQDIVLLARIIIFT